MKILWQALVGIGAALITSLLVVGAMTLAMTEGMVLPAAEPPSTEPPPSIETVFPGFATTTPRPTSRPTAVNRLVAAATQTPVQICPTPAGWEPYTVSVGDTLTSLAAGRGVSRDLIMEKNCLVSSSLVSGSQLYLPTLAPSETPQPLTATATSSSSLTPSFTPVRCGPPRGWVRYTVQFGDTLFRLSVIYNVSVADLQLANCLGWSSNIRTGEILFVPNVTPRYTATNTATFTPIPSATPAPPTATRTPSVRPPTATVTLPTLTFTPIFTATFTPIFTATFTPVFTATATPAPTAAPINTPTPTATINTPTSTATNTPVPPSTPTPTFTFTPTGT